MINEASVQPLRRKRVWLTRNVFGFALASLFSDLGHELVTALTPGFLVMLGAPPIALGLIEGISNFGQSLAELWSGTKADRVPNRAPWVYAGYTATLLKAAIALVPSWLWIIPIRTIAWLGRGARGPLRNALIADDVDRQHLGKAYGFREAFDTLGAVLGPLLAALLITHLHYRLLIGLSAIPALITILIIILTVHEVPHRMQRQEAVGLSVPSAAYPSTFVRVLVGATIFSCGYVAPTFFILRAIYLLGSQGAVTASSLAIGLYTVHNLFYALASYPSGFLADRISARFLLLMGYLLWVAVLIGFAAGPSGLIPLGILFIVSGTATALIETLQTTWSAHLLPPDIRGRGFGLMSALTGLGQLGSGVIIGILWAQIAAAPAFILSAALAFAGFVITGTAQPSSPSMLEE
jgi:MFS family permease